MTSENRKQLIVERIKYHSNKQKYGYFIGSSCIDVCASDIVDDLALLDKETLAVTKQCQDKFIEFNLSWVMNNISKTIDMHLIPRIEDAKDQVDIRYCQGMLDAISDLLTDKLCKEICRKIYDKQIQLGELPF